MLPDLVVFNGKDSFMPIDGVTESEDESSGGSSVFADEIADNGVVYLSGIGYGHGVGLCQTGANNMASQGFTYEEILDYYYTDVVIEDLIDAGF